MKAFLRDLFEYNDWANQVMYDALRVIENIEPRAWEVMNHIINSQELWLDRVSRAKPRFQSAWTTRPSTEIIESSKINTAMWVAFIERLPEDQYDQLCQYQSLEGKGFSSPYADIFAQVINHGTHHRGQLSMIIKKTGHTPPVMDYIVYSRSKR